MPMELAQRLNELAQANSDGLLSDDEYRLLRQSAFERHSQNVVVPIEKPIVPITRTCHDSMTKPASIAKREQPKENLHIKLSVTNLIRRATGRNSPITNPASPSSKLPPTPTSENNGSRRGLLPRLFHRKPNDLAPIRIIPTQSHLNLRSPLTPNSPARSLAPQPLSPSRSIHSGSSTPRKVSASIHSSSDANFNFDDQCLITSKDIQEAVVALENELLGLVDAFNNLEQSAVRRIKKRNARRLPANTPTSVDVLLEGREWREHRIVPSPSAPVFDAATKRYHVPLEPLNDGLSVYSGNSDRTSTFSHSRSISHLAQHTQVPAPSPSTPLSLHFLNTPSSLQRKTSVSSVSSRSTSFFSPSRLGVSSPGSRLSHSSSTVPLHNATQQLPAMAANEDYGELDVDPEGLEEATDQLTELDEIQYRRNEVITRYTQRIEFLKAKQKGAELHEKLLRK